MKKNALQANSYTVSSVTAPSWLHRFIIGKKGQNLAKITQQMPKVGQMESMKIVKNCSVFCFFSLLLMHVYSMQVHIEFTEGEDTIILEGPTKDVQMMHSQIEAIVADLVSSDFTSIWWHHLPLFFLFFFFLHCTSTFP